MIKVAPWEIEGSPHSPQREKHFETLSKELMLLLTHGECMKEKTEALDLCWGLGKGYKQRKKAESTQSNSDFIESIAYLPAGKPCQ
jgi:hypothetical protein